MQEVHVAELPPFQQRGKEEEGESVQLMEIDDRQVCFEVGREDGVGLRGHAAILYHILELAHHPGLALQVPLQKKPRTCARESRACRCPTQKYRAFPRAI